MYHNIYGRRNSTFFKCLMNNISSDCETVKYKNVTNKVNNSVYTIVFLYHINKILVKHGKSVNSKYNKWHRNLHMNLLEMSISIQILLCHRYMTRLNKHTKKIL